MTVDPGLGLQVLGPGQVVALSDLVGDIARILGLSAAAAGIAVIAAILYRWYARTSLPEGVAVLAGLSVVAVYLNATAVFGQLITITGDGAGLLALNVVLANTITIGAAAVSAIAGRYVGDRIAIQIGAVTGARELDAEVGRIVQSVGRVTTVDVPEEIADIEGYDPVADETKAALAGKTLVFPRRLAVADLRDRLVDRIKQDYGVGHVDVDLRDDGTVEHLGVGKRAAGVGPTLAPGTAATAVRADPANSASAGDVVQLWRPGPEPERVTTAELRGRADDVVTLALDEIDANALDDGVRYRLVTLPAEARPEREFAALLRDADETMAVVEIQAGSPLDGTPIGALDLTTIAVRAADGSVSAIPSRSRVLGAGDTLYAMARPETLRRLEAARTAATAGDGPGPGEATEAQPSL